MKIVLYSLPIDGRKAAGIANSPDQIFHSFAAKALQPNIAIEMGFTRTDPLKRRYVLDKSTRSILVEGLSEPVDDLAIVMHAGPGKLSTEGNPTTPIAGSWSQDDLSQVINVIQPQRVFFICCRFAALRSPPQPIIHGYQSRDGLSYIAERVSSGTQLYASVNPVMTFTGMPVLRPNFYTRTITGQL